MTKTLFRTAMIELMQKKSFSKITIKELCEQADLNRTTFYLHYEDQQDLLKDVVKDVKERTKKYMYSHSDSEQSVNTMKNLLEYIKANSSTYQTLMFGDSSKSLGIDMIESIFQDMKDQWPVFDDSFNNDYIYAFMMEGSTSVISKWIGNNYDCPTEKLAKMIMDFCSAVVDKMRQPGK